MTCKIHSSEKQIIEAKVILPQNAGETQRFLLQTHLPRRRNASLWCSDLRGCSKSPARKPASEDDLTIGSIKDRNLSAPGPQRAACTVANSSGHQLQKGRLEVHIGSPQGNTCASTDTIHLDILMGSTMDNRGFCAQMLRAAVDSHQALLGVLI